MEIISLLIILSYIITMCYKVKGIPNSISETYYILEHKLWFRFSIISTAILLMICLINIVSESIQFLAFLSGAGMMFVGVVPNFKEDLEGKVHQSGAFLCLISSQLLIGICKPILLYIWILFLMYVIIFILINNGKIKDKFLKSKPLFWIEIISLLNVYLFII